MSGEARPVAKIVTVVAFLIGVAALAWIGAINLIDATLRVDVMVRDTLRREVRGAQIRISQRDRNLPGRCTDAGRCFARATVSLRSGPWQLEITAPGYKPLRQEISAPERHGGIVTLARIDEPDASSANLRPE